MNEIDGSLSQLFDPRSKRSESGPSMLYQIKLGRSLGPEVVSIRFSSPAGVNLNANDSDLDVFLSGPVDSAIYWLNWELAVFLHGDRHMN